MRSYPTYEEWKLRKWSVTSLLLSVLILPMRNGNSAYWHWQTSLSGVLILPMRNGNDLYLYTVQYPHMVLILPMRNGNFPFTSFTSFLFSCSYPTYEEWKHLYKFLFFICVLFCSYPTYEEWKPSFSSVFWDFFNSSFLSYLWGMETFVHLWVF